ncbi:HAD hydrolase subfamily IA REG-2-like protein [Obba rivulosa]|uniref:HAD hydrolase subfamily IA REG-2-like protein n=1 Tax=Obba rivulosa TaxID=1052685 RepID=A0A8E2AX46_9APHY|nr:HAD hydrolase subfamily IA REG-2-like protein [Obba rivulosa]
MAIRLVLFDALHTIVTPRLPIYVQYSQTFEPYLGRLDPVQLRTSFKTALKQLQAEKPVYVSGAPGWWGEVIKRTALGAGADTEAVDKSLEEIVPRLLQRFSSREGYKLFDDTLPTLQHLKKLNIRTGLISNTDARMRAVLEDLEVLSLLDPVLLSEEEGVEKPSRELYLRACTRAGVKPEETLHVGDEMGADYYGARASGISALLIRRPGPDGEEEMREVGENLDGVETVASLLDVVHWAARKS